MLCKQLGAGLCVSEMTIADPRLWHTSKSLHRMDHVGEPAPDQRADRRHRPERSWPTRRASTSTTARRSSTSTWAARPRRSATCWAGSALMRDEALVARILEAVVAAVDVPVTLKIRTGWSRGPSQWPGHRAHRRRLRHRMRWPCMAAHAPGLLHRRGRIRHHRGGETAVAHSGGGQWRHRFDPLKAQVVLDYTGADAVMIGRAAQGRPWIFRADRALPGNRRTAA